MAFSPTPKTAVTLRLLMHRWERRKQKMYMVVRRRTIEWIEGIVCICGLGSVVTVCTQPAKLHGSLDCCMFDEGGLRFTCLKSEAEALVNQCEVRKGSLPSEAKATNDFCHNDNYWCTIPDREEENNDDENDAKEEEDKQNKRENVTRSLVPGVNMASNHRMQRTWVAIYISNR
jgi:hypothetical protein